MKFPFKIPQSKKQSNDQQLVEACARKEYRAQKQLYDKYKDAMFTIAYRIVNSADTANDVLQDAFIQVFRDIASFRGDSTPGAWIKTIVVRSALRKLRDIQKYEPESDSTFTGNEMVEWPAWINAHDLETAILALPEHYRVVFLLIEVEGYTHREVAGMLGIPEGTSKIKLFRAKQQLRKLLTGYQI